LSRIHRDLLSKEALKERLALLVNGQFAELRKLTLGQDDRQAQQFHQWLAEADMREVDLLDAFERWVPVNQYAACHTVLPALGLSSRSDVPRLMRLLRMLQERTDPRANYISEALQARFTRQPTLPSELAACFDNDGPITDMACRVWAVAFAMAQSRPQSSSSTD